MKNLAILLLFLVACKSTKHITVENKTATETFEASLKGSWKLQFLWGVDSSKLRPGNLEFDTNAGTFSGNTGCNAIGGKFTFKKDVIVFDKSMITTHMACPGYNDRNFTDLLLKVNKLTINNKTLELSQDNLVLMSLRKE